MAAPPGAPAEAPVELSAVAFDEHFGTYRGLSPAVWILAISALVARVAVVLLLGDWGPSAAGEYGSLAASLVEGSGFSINEAAGFTEHGIYEPSSLRPPTYPLILAALYSILGVKTVAAHLVAQLLNALMGAALIPLGYHMVRQAGGQHGLALLAAVLLALWPTLLLSVAFVQPLALLTLLVVISVLLWYRSIDTGSLRAWIGFSATAALLALTEPMLLVALAAAGLMILFHRKLGPALRVRNAVLLAAVSLCVLGPWTYRNWRVHGAVLPVTSTFWLNMWMGNNPSSSGTERLVLSAAQLERFQETGRDNLRQFDLLTDAQRQELDGRRAMEREAIWKSYALGFIRQDTARYVKLCQIRLAKTVWADWDNPRSRDPFLMYFISRGLLLVGTLLGLFMASWSRWRIGWPSAIMAACVVTCTLTITSARAAIPLEPLQISLASLVLFTLGQSLVVRHQRPPIVRRFMGEVNDGQSPDSLAFARRSSMGGTPS